MAGTSRLLDDSGVSDMPFPDDLFPHNSMRKDMVVLRARQPRRPSKAIVAAVTGAVGLMAGSAATYSIMARQNAVTVATLTGTIETGKQAAVSSALLGVKRNTTAAVNQAVAAALANQQRQFDAQLKLEKQASYSQGIIDEHKKLKCDTVTVGSRNVLWGVANTVWRGQTCRYG